jgi:small subunit ribosomal protein S9
MADEPQSPEDPERSEEEAAAFAEHRAVPTEEAAEIAGSVEDASLEAFEEAQSATETQVEEPAQASAEEEAAAGEPAVVAVEEVAEELAAEEATVEAVADELVEEAVEELVEEELAVAELAVEEAVEELVAEEVVAELVAQDAAESPSEEQPSVVPAVQEPTAEVEAEEEDFEEEEDEEPAPRVKPAVPGAHLEVDIVPEGVDPLARETPADPYAIEEYAEDVTETEEEVAEELLPQPISTAAIDLAAGARYRATGKRKTAIARVILRPGSGVYLVNGRTLEEHFPRTTLQRNIRQPLETVGYEERMDVVARLHGGGISAQAGALRHGVSRALLEADPNLRGELKRRGFLTRDSRAKERKKAGLKKARKRPQFSKR